MARIFIYGVNYAPELISTGRYTGEIGAYLTAQGHPVEVVTAPPHYPDWSVKAPFANRYGVERAPGLRITRCPLVLNKQMRGVWRLLAPLSFALTSGPVGAWRILASRPQTVLCIEPTLLCAPLALLAAKVVGARTVLHVQDLEIDAAFAVGHLTGGWLKALALGFEAITIRRFDRVITISGRMRQRLLAKGVAAERIVVIRNWVDTDHIRPLAGPNRFRRELGVADDAFVALYAGSLGAKQALHIVMDAAERLKDQPGIVFIIAGDGPERARLIGRGLANVRFLPLQPEALLPELLAAADVHLLPQVAGVADLVLPSKLGGMLASGKPLIVQTEPGAELHGFLQGAACITPPGDAEALASAIQARAPDTAERVQLRKALAERLSSAKSLPDLLGVLTS